MLKKQDIKGTKIAIIGTGAVGSTVAYAATIRNLASEIVLIDRDDKKEEGHVMDISDAMCLVETGCVKTGDPKDARDADVIIITAGLTMKASKVKTRLELVDKNKEILKSIIKSIGKIKKTSIIIVVSNPVDVLTHIAQKVSGLPKNQVIGTGTGLDTVRLRSQLAHRYGVSAENVHGYVLGEHGNSEFVAWSSVTVGGMPIKQMKGFTPKLAKKIEHDVMREAYKIIERKGATYYGIGLVTTDLIEAILYDQHKILPVAAQLSGWNGVSGCCAGIPAVIGRSGVEKLWPLQLSAGEKKRLAKSAAKIKKYL